MNTEQELVLLKNCTPGEACRYIATKIRQIRRSEKETQERFSKRVGVPLRTYKRLETHGHASLETFIQVLSAVGRTQYLFLIFPQQRPASVKPTMDERLQLLTPTKFTK
jgi:transcriptional regulator with XRE-family HTH domain